MSTYDCDETDYNEFLKFKNGKYDIKYVGQNTKNCLLHIIAIYVDLFEEIKDRLIELKLLSINFENNKKRTCIHLALKNNNYKFIDYVLGNFEQRPDFYVKDIKNMTMLDWAIYKKSDKYIYDFLKIGAPFEERTIEIARINRVEDNFIQEVLLNVLNNTKNFTNDYEEDFEFKIFKKEDFDDLRVATSGSYGSVFIGYDKNGKKYAIKRFDKKLDGFLSDDKIREIVFLNFLKNSEHIVKIYGIFFDDVKNMFLVEECLERDLHEQISIIKRIKDGDETINQLKKTLFQCLLCVEENSKYGIIHCDTKSNNLMIDITGKIKYIDYGLSNYLGISPLVTNINKIIHNGYYLAQDGCGDNLLTKYFDYDQNLLFEIERGYLGINLDIPSVAIIFIGIICYKYTGEGGFFYYDGNLYSNLKKTNEGFAVNLNIPLKEVIIDKFGYDFANVFFSMLEVNQNIRKTSKELIESPFFQGMGQIEFPRNLPLTEILNIQTDGESKFSKFNHNFYNSINSKNYIKEGFIYYDEIITRNYNNEFEIKVLPPRIKKIFKNFVFLISYNLDKIPFNGDALFSTLYYFYDLMKIINNKFLESEENITLTLLMILFQYSKLFDKNFNYSYTTMIGYYKFLFNKNVNTEKIKKFFDLVFVHILNDINFYNFRPTMLYFGYIKFILQLIIVDESIISDILIKFNNNLISILIQDEVEFNLNPGKYKISQLISHAYNNVENRIQINI